MVTYLLWIVVVACRTFSIAIDIVRGRVVEFGVRPYGDTAIDFNVKSLLSLG